MNTHTAVSPQSGSASGIGSGQPLLIPMCEIDTWAGVNWVRQSWASLGGNVKWGTGVVPEGPREERGDLQAPLLPTLSTHRDQEK